MLADQTRTIRRIVAIIVIFVLGAIAQGSGLLGSIYQYRSDVLYLTPQHIALAAISGGLAILVGVPLGVAVSRPSFRYVANSITRVINLGTTVPTLAILALAMTVLGLGAPSAIFGLFVLTLLPILLNTVAGLRSVPPTLIEAARGMGMTAWQILLEVELPNAAYVIMAGIRTALVINIGTVPLAFLIGGGGLGELIFTGIDLMEPGMLLAGAIATAVLAIAVDAFVANAQYWLVPRGVNPLR
ncbi:MAG: ABC transporter permease [Acetobacteraceae bacterium]